MTGAIVYVVIGVVVNAGGWFLVGQYWERRRREKHFWDGYAQGVREERQRQAEEARPIASRLADGPLIYGVLFDELTKGKPTQ